MKEKMKALVQRAGETTKRVTDRAKIELEIQRQKKQIRNYKQIVGEYVIAHQRLMEDPIVSEQMGRILDAQRKIEKLLEKRLKNH